MWTITNFSGSTPVRRPSAVNPAKIRTNLICSKTTVHWPHFCHWLLRPIFMQSRMVSSESHKSHNIRTTSVQSAQRTLTWIGHSRSFKVILIGVNRNPLRGDVVGWLKSMNFYSFPIAISSIFDEQQVRCSVICTKKDMHSWRAVSICGS